MKALYWLHGIFIQSWFIQELSQKYNNAVFMPSGENNFYFDDVDNGGEYVRNDLVKFTRKMFPI